MKNLRVWRTMLLIIACCMVGLSANAYHGKHAPEMGEQQDTFGLERRISSLEQRLSYMETNMRRLEQQAVLNSTRSSPSNGQRDLELEVLQRQLGTLQGQLDALGCGLARLDERTLPAGTREARKRAGQSAQDPCRLNPEVPLQLPAQP